jgi:bifunctional UDP-N-acetylglucosamine pyrophosphorylase/glucosamine-1-phosphate N-acetyltransferase
MKESVSVVILAAGLGTRMRSRRAKVLHRAGGLTLIEHVAAAATSVAAEDRVVVVVGHQADEVRRIFAGRRIRFADQVEQKGTGHAVMMCRDAVPHDGLLVLLYGDGPLLSAATLEQLIARQHASDAAATVITAELNDPTGYGRIIRATDGSVAAIVEQKAATEQQKAVREINSGIYCFRAELLWKHIDEIGCDNPAGEYYLTDIVEIFRQAGLRVEAMRLDDPRELLGINTRVELAEVDAILRERKVRQLMLEGITIIKPETVTIDAGVTIGIDTVIEPFAQILGRTIIGENCRIGACSIITESDLGDGVDVGPFSIVGTSVIGAAAHIGPYARLRMENHVEPGAHVGNFVELKKTRLGSGSKAMHLAYLGDSSIGRDVNIGAGTITCNYDGHKKHGTRIGDGAFIGSNSTLVAPLEIGEGAYTAAGSVITDPVPPDALAIGRGRQAIKEGWARARRAVRELTSSARKDAQ